MFFKNKHPDFLLFKASVQYFAHSSLASYWRGGKKNCMATDMHADGSHHHGNANSTLYSNSFTRTFWVSIRIGRRKKRGKTEELQKNLWQSETSSNSLLVSARLRVCGSADRLWSQKVRDSSSEQCVWRGARTGGQSQGHPGCHNEISLSLLLSMATSRRDNNAFNFGLPSILRLCIGVVAAGWLLAHNGCSLRAFP